MRSIVATSIAAVRRRQPLAAASAILSCQSWSKRTIAPSIIPISYNHTHHNVTVATVPRVSAHRYLSVSPAAISSSTSKPQVARVARYTQTGQVEAVLKVIDEEIPSLRDGEILIRMLAAPMNPADFNMVEGVYSILPPLPAVGGNEGVGVVDSIGANVDQVKVGDWVIPAKPGFGTWRTHAVCHQSDVDVVHSDIPHWEAATVAVNPCTAWRMLHDFVSLKRGDVIVQNGANSGVGQAVIQLCRHLGIRTINILRDRPNFNETVERLKSLGADLVVSEQFVSSIAMKKMMEEKKMTKPVLGLNCVGGDTSVEISRMLADGSPMVTYGGMSRRPVMVPTGRQIFNDISLRGFWLSRWVQNNSKEDRQKMINALTDLIRAGKLKSHIEVRPFSDFAASASRAREGYRDKKIVLELQK